MILLAIIGVLAVFVVDRVRRKMKMPVTYKHWGWTFVIVVVALAIAYGASGHVSGH